MPECLHTDCDREFDTLNGRNTHIGMVHDMETLSLNLLKSLEERPKYQEVVNKTGISPTVYEKYFGSWSNALEKAGFETWKRTGESNPSWNGGKETVYCEYCNKEYQVTPSLIERSRFCSNNCKHSWMSENLVGEDSHSWKENVVDKSNHYNGIYNNVRRRVKNRDNGCIVCGEEKVDAHHIKPVKEFDDPENAHTMDNMVSLCRKHHKEYENEYTNLQADEFKSKVLNQ